MNCDIANLEPKCVWKHFAAICDVPRPSKKEEKMVEFMLAFGKEHGLETHVDEIGNVLFRKPATPGMENRKGIVLQGHLDMVPQKNNDTVHNFETDPIQPYIDGDWVKAKGTTLGADNGIGLAAAMAVLVAKDLEHGPIEALFTTDEETGMTGAFGLKNTFLKGDILINLDSEDEGEVFIGCAGGVDTNVEFSFKKEPVPANHRAFQLTVKGLRGGHSGCDIHLGRGNANKIMNRFLWMGERECGLRIHHVDGGSLRNALPRESVSTVVLPADKVDDFKKRFHEVEKLILNELSSTEPGLTCIIEPVALPDYVMDTQTQTRFVGAVYGCPHGVYNMIADMPDVVETSNNLAMIKFKDTTISIGTLQRSSVDSAKEDLATMIRSVFELAGADKIVHEGSYPGWKPNLKSPVLATSIEQYKKCFGVEPEVKVIHAGLECGLIGDVYPNMDLISFGPTIRNPHSPDEMLNIPTVTKFWDFTVEILKNAPVK
ncbi:MAG: cytosol nonspecific dipeptidase [Acidobacteria bacterium]|nr:MAG: cytosol nonspecific dipeptidase [Acidobacteriota bacterium]